VDLFIHNLFSLFYSDTAQFTCGYMIHQNRCYRKSSSSKFPHKIWKLESSAQSMHTE